MLRLFLLTNDDIEVALFSATLHQDKDMGDRLLAPEGEEHPNRERV